MENLQQCIKCKKAGKFKKWQICENSHTQYICTACCANFDTKRCLIQQCEAFSKVKKINELIGLKSKWTSYVNELQSLAQKVQIIEKSIKFFHYDTYRSFKKQLQKYELVHQSKNDIYAIYLRKFTQYFLKSKSYDIKNEFHQIDQIQSNSTKVFVNLIEKIKQFHNNLQHSQAINPLPTISSNCIICYNNFTTFHLWNFCEYEHEGTSICSYCMSRLEKCPVCRGRKKENSSKCMDYLIRWDQKKEKYSRQSKRILELIDTLKNKHISDTSKRLVLDQLTYFNQQISKDNSYIYSKLCESLIQEWINEQIDKKATNIFDILSYYNSCYIVQIISKSKIALEIEQLNKQMNLQTMELPALEDSASRESVNQKSNTQSLFESRLNLVSSSRSPSYRNSPILNRLNSYMAGRRRRLHELLEQSDQSLFIQRRNRVFRLSRSRSRSRNRARRS